MNYHLAYEPEWRTEGGNYDYSMPLISDRNKSLSLFISKLLATKAFKRLDDIRFLGALDYCLVVRPNGANQHTRYTRAQHSKGVAALAVAYLDLVEHTNKDQMVCVAAALLHDIGHAPFSHTLEPVFKRHFNIDHHQASTAIILGDKLSREIALILNEHGIDPEEVVDTLSGSSGKFDNFFSGPINFDTIEGILRSRSYLKMQNLGLTPLRVLRSAITRGNESDRAVVDAFWACKDDVYNVVIRSKTGVAYDTLFQKVVESRINNYSVCDFFITEAQAFKKHSELRSASNPRDWPKIISELFPQELRYQVRNFYINDLSSFFDREDSKRYRQSKGEGCLTRAEICRLSVPDKQGIENECDR